MVKSFFLTLVLSPLLVFAYPWYEVNYFHSGWQGTTAGDCLLILGSKVLKDNQPDLMMTERLETAKKLIGKETNHIILSGGTVDSKKTEAEVMANWLEEQGIPKEKMILETRSTSTFENLTFSKPLIAQADCEKLDILSHDFHLARVRMTAERLGIPVNRYIPAEMTKEDSSQRTNREYLAYLWYWLGWRWVSG